MRVVAVVTLQAKPWTCCGAFTLFQMYRRGKSAGLTPAAVSMLGLGLSVFKRLRQADQHSAHERGIILRERVHDLQSSLARRTHGSLRLPCVRTERLLHVRACVGSPARDVVENGFPLLFGAVALASWAACLTPSRNFSSNASSSLSPFFTLDSSKLAPPSVSFCSATLLASTTLSRASSIPASALERAFSTSILPSPTPTLTPSVTLRTTLLICFRLSSRICNASSGRHGGRMATRRARAAARRANAAGARSGS